MQQQEALYRTPRGIAEIGAPDAAWQPLKITSALANTVEDISYNIESALRRDYIPFNALLGKKSGAVAIVGSGPSLKANWGQLKRFRGDIIACNASAQFLLAKGIIPAYMMCFDADPLMLEFITPHPDITYLMGSRCPPRAFDLLAGCRVVIWHAAGDERISELLTAHGKMEPMVIGGSAAVTRAMILALPMGYTSVHLFGADSSFADGDTHIRQSTTTERRMAVMCNGRVFETAPWMCQQVEDFKALAPQFAKNHGVDFIVHGDGLIPHVAMSMGFKTDLEPRSRRFCRIWKNRSKALWQQL
jgi:hypothetical protein